MLITIRDIVPHDDLFALARGLNQQFASFICASSTAYTFVPRDYPRLPDQSAVCASCSLVFVLDDDRESADAGDARVGDENLGISENHPMRVSESWKAVDFESRLNSLNSGNIPDLRNESNTFQQR